jgi:hypothetical protein
MVVVLGTPLELDLKIEREGMLQFFFQKNYVFNICKHPKKNLRLIDEFFLENSPNN